VRIERSRVMIRDTFATEFFERPNRAAADREVGSPP
jgi:hypothetical protein